MRINRNAKRVRGQLAVAGRNQELLKKVRKLNRVREDLVKEFSENLRAAHKDTKDHNKDLLKWGYGNNMEIFSDNYRKASIRRTKGSLAKLKAQPKPRLPK